MQKLKTKFKIKEKLLWIPDIWDPDGAKKHIGDKSQEKLLTNVSSLPSQSAVGRQRVDVGHPGSIADRQALYEMSGIEK